MLQYLRSAIFIVQMYVAMAVIGLAFAPWAMFSRRGAFAACKGYSRYVFWSAGWMVGLRCEVRGTVPEGEALIAAYDEILDKAETATNLEVDRLVQLLRREA